MIRILFAAALALTTTSAYATPAVGDFAGFDMQVTNKQGKTADGTFSWEITQKNDSTHQFMRKQIVNFSGKDQVNEEWQAADDFMSDESIDAILANCASMGTPQKISVPAGDFDTCLVTEDGAETTTVVNIAKVPFGFVQINQTNKSDGMNVVLKLRNSRQQ